MPGKKNLCLTPLPSMPGKKLPPPAPFGKPGRSTLAPEGDPAGQGLRPMGLAGDGISKYSTNPPAAGESLIACLDQALEDVPKARHAITPLYLGATAGMRLLK